MTASSHTGVFRVETPQLGGSPLVCQTLLSQLTQRLLILPCSDWLRFTVAVDALSGLKDLVNKFPQLLTVELGNIFPRIVECMLS